MMFQREALLKVAPFEWDLETSNRFDQTIMESEP
jgi:hypothetical protein